MRICRGLILLIMAAAQPVYSGEVYPKIRNIIISNKNIFDEKIAGENKWWFRAANKLHFVTKPEVIRRELLLKEGDACNPKLAEESERNLRSNYDFLKEVRVRCVLAGEGISDLMVEISDTWTTQFRIDFGREGEENFYLIGFEESNLAGRGKNLGLFYSQLGRRNQQEIRYADPQLFGSRVRSVTLLSKQNIGDQAGAEFSRPFYARDTLYAGNIAGIKQNYERGFLEDGNRLFSFYHDQRYFELGSGMKVGDSEAKVNRLKLKFSYQEDKFSSLSGIHSAYLSDRRVIGALVGWSFIEEDFIKTRHVNKMQKIEDINLGKEIQLDAGYAPTYLGSDRNRLIFNLDGQRGFRLAKNSFNLTSLGAEGRKSNKEFENTLLYLNTNFITQFDRRWSHTFIFHSEAVYGVNLDKENSVKFGGRSGLRGYRTNFFNGDRAVLGNLEYRVVNPREFFHLFYFGGAVFCDIGTIGSDKRSWFRSVKSDVGLGLRILPSRASSGNPWRLDVSRQIHFGSQKEAWVISLFGGQAFRLFNNSVRDIQKKPTDILRENDSSLRHVNN